MNNNTMKFDFQILENNQAKEIIMSVYECLAEKGYNPINQIVGYLISGDPTYITSYKNARILIQKLERDELLEELLREYIYINSKKK
jgi:uncharacterized protein (UPF0297 family)